MRSAIAILAIVIALTGWPGRAAVATAPQISTVLTTVATETGQVPPEHSAEVTPDGRYVAFTTVESLLPSDSNTRMDLYLRDMQTGQLELITVNLGGTATGSEYYFSSPLVSMSPDARYIAFVAKEAGYTLEDTSPYMDYEIYVRDRLAGTTEIATRDYTGAPAPIAQMRGMRMSQDGRYTSFDSITALMPGESCSSCTFDVYQFDRQTQAIHLVSVDQFGQRLEGDSQFRDASADGRYVFFDNYYTDWRSYVRDVVAGTTTLVEPGARLTQAVTDNGRFVLYGGSGGAGLLLKDMVAGHRV